MQYFRGAVLLLFLLVFAFVDFACCEGGSCESCPDPDILLTPALSTKFNYIAPEEKKKNSNIKARIARMLKKIKAAERAKAYAQGRGCMEDSAPVCGEDSTKGIRRNCAQEMDKQEMRGDKQEPLSHEEAIEQCPMTESVIQDKEKEVNDPVMACTSVGCCEKKVVTQKSMQIVQPKRVLSENMFAQKCIGVKKAPKKKPVTKKKQLRKQRMLEKPIAKKCDPDARLSDHFALEERQNKTKCEESRLPAPVAEEVDEVCEMELKQLADQYKLMLQAVGCAEDEESYLNALEGLQ